MPDTAIRFYRDIEAEVFAVTKDGGTTNAASRLAEGSPFAPVMGWLFASLAAVAEQASASIEQLKPAVQPAAIAQLVKRNVCGPYQDARDAVISAERSRAEREVRFAEPPRDMPYADRDVAVFGALDAPDQWRWVEKANRSMLAAVICAGKARFTVADDLWDRAVERNAALTIIERLGTQAEHQLRPTPDKPTRSGPDVASAEAAALAIIQDWRDEQQQIDDVNAALRSVIVAIAAATDTTINEAFALLNGETP